MTSYSPTKNDVTSETIKSRKRIKELEKELSNPKIKGQTKIVEEIAIELSDKIKVGKLDVDANQTSAAQQNVMSIPTLAIFKGGELVAQQVGALSKTQLTEFIESNL